MVLTLYAHPISTCGRRVAALLHEKNVPYKLVAPDIATNEIKSEKWVAKHPFGMMPFIDVSSIFRSPIFIALQPPTPTPLSTFCVRFCIALIC
jgi:glutathione S-transferase